MNKLQLNRTVLSYAKGLSLYLGFVVFWLVATSASLEGQSRTIDPELFELSLDQLSSVTITSVSRKKELLSETASAVYVLTSEDIKRSGATSIPEALRLVPGVQVARVGANYWSISIRGLRDLFANKLLVLVDGRSVYTPLFSGVYWDVQDTILDDIERIEVIRGPGATVWGANAVNGVISIITKSSKKTSDTLLSLGGGNEDLGQAFVRSGFSVSDALSGRVYAKATARDGLKSAEDLTRQQNDSMQQYRAGFRIDRNKADSEFTLQGDIYTGLHREDFSVIQRTPPFIDVKENNQDVSGLNVLARALRRTSEASSFTLQVYYDRIERDGADLAQTRDTFDLDLQQRYRFDAGLDLVWGMGYRFFDIAARRRSFIIEPLDSPDTFDRPSAFFQLQKSLSSKASITIGSKLSDNDFSGFEYQPSIRGRYTPWEHSNFWFAVARAVRTPSSVEHFGRLNAAFFPGEPGAPLNLVSIIGSPEFDSEELFSYEVGAKHKVGRSISFDYSLFWNEYDRLLTVERLDPFFEESLNTLTLPRVFDNFGEASTYGGEFVLNFEPLSMWRVQASYSFVDINTRLDTGSRDSSLMNRESESPQHQFVLRTLLNLGGCLQLDPTLRYVDRVLADSAPAYIELDMRVGIKISDDISLSLVGTNLLNPSHFEGAPTGRALSPARVERAVFGQVRFGL